MWRDISIAVICGFAVISAPSNCRSDELADNQVETRSVEKQLAAAKAKFRKNLIAVPEYQAAQTNLEDCTAAVKAADGKGDEFKTAFKAKIAAQAELKTITDILESTDPSIKELSERLSGLKSKQDELVAAQKIRDQRKDEEKKRGRLLGQFGDLEIRLVSFGVSKIPLIDLGRRTQSKDKLLYAVIRIENYSATKKVSYSTWRGGIISINEDFATAKDNFGNSLKRIDFGIGTQVADAVKDNESIYPGKSVDDVLVFEEPVDGTTKITLELPRKNIGVEGDAIIAELSMK